MPPDVQLPARLAFWTVRPPVFQELVDFTGEGGNPRPLSFKKRMRLPRGRKITYARPQSIEGTVGNEAARVLEAVGGAAAIWPLCAVGSPRKWRIGFLHPGQSVTVNSRIVAFREGLGASGPGEDPQMVGASRRTVGTVARDGRGPRRQNDRRSARLPSGCPRGARCDIFHSDHRDGPRIQSRRKRLAKSLAHPGGNITGIFLDLPDLAQKPCSVA